MKPSASKSEIKTRRYLGHDFSVKGYSLELMSEILRDEKIDEQLIKQKKIYLQLSDNENAQEGSLKCVLLNHKNEVCQLDIIPNDINQQKITTLAALKEALTNPDFIKTILEFTSKEGYTPVKETQFNLVGGFYQFDDAGNNLFPEKIQKFILQMDIVESMSEEGEPQYEIILAIRSDKLDDPFGDSTKSLENEELNRILSAASRHDLKCSSDRNEILSGTIKFEICSQSDLVGFLQDKDFSQSMYFTVMQIVSLNREASSFSLELTNPHDEGKFSGLDCEIGKILNDVILSGMGTKGPSSRDAAASEKNPSLGSSGGSCSFYGGRPPSPTASSSSGAEGLVVTSPGS